MSQSGFSRRSLIKSSLAIPAVALPVLRSSPLLGATPDVRLVVFYSANGTIPETWKPRGTTDAWEFPAEGILEPLAKWKAKLNLLWGVHYKSGEKGPGAAHQKGIVACLTGLRAIQKDPGYATGISVDQWMANKWGAATRFKTVEFGVKNRTSGNRGCISYLGANQPVFPENDPVKAYARYLGNFTPAASTGGPLIGKRPPGVRVWGWAARSADRPGQSGRWRPGQDDVMSIGTDRGGAALRPRAPRPAAGARARAGGSFRTELRRCRRFRQTTGPTSSGSGAAFGSATEALFPPGTSRRASGASSSRTSRLRASSSSAASKALARSSQVRRSSFPA